jgi:hypothetical protein
MGAMVQKPRLTDDSAHATRAGLKNHEEFDLLSTAFTLGALRLPPRFSLRAVRRPKTAPWRLPETLPPPANRPDDAAELPLALPAEPVPQDLMISGWHDSSLDLKLGLTVRDLGPVAWLDELDDVLGATESAQLNRRT